MRTMIKLMAVCLSCILLGTASVQAAEVSSTEKSTQAEEILKKRPYNSYGEAYADSHYGYVSYRWKGKGLCIQETIKDGKLQKKEIPLRGKAKKYAKKRGRYAPPYSHEWMDTKGNFYFLTTETHKKKCSNFLNKVNKKGKLVKRTKLNDWLKIKNCPDYKRYYDGIKNYCDIFIMHVTEHEVIANYSNHDFGQVIFDRNTGKVKRQIVTGNHDDGAFDQEPTDREFFHKQKQFTLSKDGKLFCQELTAGKKITLPSGNKIRYQKVKKRKQIGKLSGNAETKFEELRGLKARELERLRVFAARKNYVYLLAPEGYYRINTKDLSMERLASTSELPLWKYGYSNAHLYNLAVLSEKEFILEANYYSDSMIRDEHDPIPIWQGKINS